VAASNDDTGVAPHTGAGMRVAALVLAAGGGSRLGHPKAEIVVGGRRLVDSAVASCVAAGLSPVVVVFGAVWVTPTPPASSHDGHAAKVWLVENTEWATGIASSLQAGLAALAADPHIDAVVVTLVDTPCVGPEHLSRICSALRGGAVAAVGTYEGKARTPVGLTRQVWAEVAATVSGDRGASTWLAAHRHLVTNVELADLGAWTDIDTPADLPD
jgi:CTP:molybdopterin cytidylyltransferase MocA